MAALLRRARAQVSLFLLAVPSSAVFVSNVSRSDVAVSSNQRSASASASTAYNLGGY